MSHHIEPRWIDYAEEGADGFAQRLAEVLFGIPVCVLVDKRTRAAAGEEVAAALLKAGVKTGLVEIADPYDALSYESPVSRVLWPVCDDATKRSVSSALGGCRFIIAVGSGVINDLAKWIAFEKNMDYACFATAVSMNGYASANVAPTLGGVKSLVAARPPIAVASSHAVLSRAPVAMTTAGLGDVLAKSVSSADWRMNHILFGDHYCPRAVALIDQLEPLYLEKSDTIFHGKAEGIEVLFRALLLTGAAMTMAGSSAPASGGEHLISHALDMMSSLDRRPHDLHGRQVGLGTILASALYERLLALDNPIFHDALAPLDANFWGHLSPAIARQYESKKGRLERACQILSKGGQWDHLRETLSPMVRPARVTRKCLQRAGGAWRAEHIGCDRRRLKQAFSHAHEIRGRFTILDLARMVGLMPDVMDDILDECS